MNNSKHEATLLEVLAAIPGVVRETVRSKSPTLEAAEKRLKMHLPDDLRLLYSHCKIDAINEFLAHGDLISLYDLQHLVRWTGMGLVERAQLPNEWRSAEFLTVGQTNFGDDILYCLGEKSHERFRGSILATDHEHDLCLSILAESLGGWLARLIRNRGVEFAIIPGELEDMSPQDALGIAREHSALNPACEWAARIVYDADHPSECRLTYWDDRGHRIRPIEEIQWLERAQLKNVKQAGLSALQGLKELRLVSISDFDFSNTQPLGELDKLEWLGLSNGPPLSVAPLAKLRRLKQIRSSKVMLRDFSSLAAMSSLEFIELSCVPEADIAGISSIRSLTKVALSKIPISSVDALASLPELEYLQIDKTQVCSIVRFLESKSLKTVCVQTGQLDTESISLFKSRRPDVELVEW